MAAQTLVEALIAADAAYSQRAAARKEGLAILAAAQAKGEVSEADADQIREWLTS